jgi:hypothetical protein
MPLPLAGGNPALAVMALTNWRKRPTVTRYLSSRNPLTLAGSAKFAAPPAPEVYVRSYVPDGATTLAQQLSLLAPQLVVPIALTAQLGGSMQAPSAHAGVDEAQATATLH